MIMEVEDGHVWKVRVTTYYWEGPPIFHFRGCGRKGSWSTNSLLQPTTNSHPILLVVTFPASLPKLKALLGVKAKDQCRKLSLGPVFSMLKCFRIATYQYSIAKFASEKTGQEKSQTKTFRHQTSLVFLSLSSPAMMTMSGFSCATASFKRSSTRPFATPSRLKKLQKHTASGV